MENWSYRLREFLSRNKRDLIRYGICVWMIFVGLAQSLPGIAVAGLVAALVMHAHDRWGRPWAERGRAYLQQRAKNKESKTQ